MKVVVPDVPVERTQVIVAIELLEALNQASGGAAQLCFHRRDPRFLLMRDGLDVAKALCIKLLPQSIQVGEREKKLILT
jgi:hypothetical protein